MTQDEFMAPALKHMEEGHPITEAVAIFRGAENRLGGFAEFAQNISEWLSKNNDITVVERQTNTAVDGGRIYLIVSIFYKAKQ